MDSIQLNDGRSMPQLGFGVWQIGPEEVVGAVRTAIEVGYRSIDTASVYGNEEGVGEAVRICGVPRDELFITTKLWNPDQTRPYEAFQESLDRLKLEYVDLYLIHWPTPKLNVFVDTWQALIEIQKQGRARSIGVSNFTATHLNRILVETNVVPAVNQIELHPWLQQGELRAFHAEHGIVTESWSPLGQGKGLLEHPTITAVARKHERTPGQVVLRWHLQLGLVVIPKSSNPARIRENFEVFGFKLDGDDMSALAALDEGRRLGGDPEAANYGV